MQLTVNVVEPLGAFMDLRTVTSTGAAIVARTATETAVAAGEALTLYADTRRLHLFAPGSHGANLGLGKA